MNTNQTAEWIIQEIHKVVEEYWEKPDWLGLQVVLAFLGATMLRERIPFWLHIVGGPGSGKTELGLAPIEDTSDTHFQLDMMTPQTFLSGFTSGDNDGKENSYLHRIGEAGLISMGDFTTIMEQPEYVVKAIAGQLRRIFDGSFSKETGVHNPNSIWFGKLSFITAMTPEAFERWNTYNAMGERFLAVQWRSAESTPGMRAKILAQASMYAKEDENAKELTPKKIVRNLTNWLIQGAEATHEWPPMCPVSAALASLPGLLEEKKPDVPQAELGEALLAQPGMNLFKMADSVALLRTTPKRRRGGAIGRVENKESSQRLQHQLLKAIRGYAFINRREIIKEDMQVVRRLAMDSIPLARTAIMSGFLSTKNAKWISTETIKEWAGYIQLEPLEDDLLQLYALGVLKPRQSTLTGADAEFRLTDEFYADWKEAFGE